MDQRAIAKNSLKFFPRHSSPLSNSDWGTKQLPTKNAASADTCNRSPVDGEIRHSPWEKTFKNRRSLDGFNGNRAETGYMHNIDEHSGSEFVMEWLSMLLKSPLFSQTPISILKNVAPRLQIVYYNAGECVVRRGEPLRFIYWVLEGVVDIGNGQEQSIELRQGSSFGGIDILLGRPSSAKVNAKSKVVIGVLSHEAFNWVVQQYPEIERRILEGAEFEIPDGGGKICTHIDNDDSSTKKENNYVDANLTLQNFMQHFSLFQDLSVEATANLTSCVEEVNIKEQDYVFKKGEKGSDVYLIASGSVEVLRTGTHSDSLNRVDILSFGNFLGIMSFLSHLKGNSDPRRNASAVAASPVKLLIIKSDILENLCKKHTIIIDRLDLECKKRFSLIANRSCYLESPTKLSIDFLTNLDKDNLPIILSHESSLDNSNVSHGPLSYPVSKSKYRKVESFNMLNVKSNIRTRMEDEDENEQKITTEANSNEVAKSLDIYTDSYTNLRGNEYSRNKRIKLRGANENHLMVSDRLVIDQILPKVFEYLSLPELMRLRLVCKAWNKVLSTASNLCKKLDLSQWNTSIDDRSLVSITNFAGGRPTYINISNCFHLTDDGFRYMINEIGIYGRIKKLIMTSNWEISGTAIMDMCAYKIGRHLEEIDLSNCRKVRDDVLIRLTGWDLTEGKLTENHENNMVGCNNLKIIKLGYCKRLTDDFMYYIAKNASLRLENLDLTRCTSITDQGFAHWNDSYFPNLKTLALKDCTFLTDKAISSIAKAANNLEILNLKFCCAISDISVDILCLGCPKLKHLDLSFCGNAVDDFSLASISYHLKYLERLLLKGCVRVTRAGIDYLLGGSTLLKSITASQCKNAHIYPDGTPAQNLYINSQTKKAFVTSGPNVIEIIF